MVAVFGQVKKQKAPRAAGETAELRQMESLEVWAASLKAKQLSAVRADRREQCRSRGSIRGFPRRGAPGTEDVTVTAAMARFT